MKKILMLLVIVSVTGKVFSQSKKFGVTGGVQNIKVIISQDNIDTSADETGYYIGGFTTINLSNSLDFYPSIQFASVKDESYIILPSMLKYNISEKYNLQGGLQFTYFMGSVGVKDNNVSYELVKRFSTGLAFGGGFNFTEKVTLDMRYNIGLTDITGKDMDKFMNSLAPGATFDGKQKMGGIQVGIGYKF